MKFAKSASISVTIAALFATAVCMQAQHDPLPSHRADLSAGQAVPQTQSRHRPTVAPPATCTYSFSTGDIYTDPATYMQYCITVNGTFANFQSPAYVEMLDQGGSHEGYGMCDTGSGTAVGYYDYGDGGNSGNWGAPILLKSTTSEVKIERSTSDGIWTLTQTITAQAGPPPDVKILMALKNNSAIIRYPVFLRFAAFVPDGASANESWLENFDSTQNSTFGYNSYSDAQNNYSGQYGMMLQNVGSPTPMADYYSSQGVTQNTDAGPNPCNLPLTSQTVIYGYGSGYLQYGFNIPAEKTVTLTSRYLSF